MGRGSVRILLLCATDRGIRFLEALRDLDPEAKIDVVSFREDPVEPPYLDDLGAAAARSGVEVLEARELSPTRLQQRIGLPDLVLAVNWRYRVPAAVYERARFGSFVFHDSFLPEYRGFSPTVWAMANGEDHTGVTLFEMTEAIDAGDIVDQVRIPILPTETIAQVTEKVTEAYLDMLKRVLPLLLSGSAPRMPQDEARATYTCKRLPEDNEIHWTHSTRRINDLIRAVSKPYPGAFTHVDGRRLIVWTAQYPDEAKTYVGRVPGRVVKRYDSGDVLVLTGDGSLLLDQVQLDGGPRVPAAEVLTGMRSTLGRA